MESPENSPAPSNSPTAPDFQIMGSIQKAWEDTAGTKLTYWGAVGILIGIAFAFGIVQGLMTGNPDEPNIIAVLIGLVSQVISTILGAGIMMMAVKRARGEAIKSSMVFDQFDKALSLILFAILGTIAIAIGFLLLIIPGIYLSICYFFAVPLIVDKKYGAWEAMETSRKVVTSRWFQYFGLFLMYGLIVFVSALPLGIGLIWTVPMGYNLIGNMYQDAFG